MRKLLSLALAATMLLTIAACGAKPAAVPNPALVLGEKYLTDLDYEQALLQFDQAIEIEPKNPRGYLGKADALLHLDRQPDAVQTLDTGTKSAKGDARTALKAAQAEVAESLVDGYIGLSSAYETLGWREIAVALLKRVCEELPEESRLKEALERLMGVIEEMSVEEGTEQLQKETPANVFTYKDFETLGLLNGDGLLDIYAVAEKCGFSKGEVDASKSSWDETANYHLGSVENITTYSHRLMFGTGHGHYDAIFFDNIPGFTLPRGVRIGMSVDEVLSCFYCPPEKRAEVIAQIMSVELPIALENSDEYSSYFVDIYNDFEDFAGGASLYPGSTGDQIPHYSLFYSDAIYSDVIASIHYYYDIELDPNNNTVKSIALRTRIEEAT